MSNRGNHFHVSMFTQIKNQHNFENMMRLIINILRYLCFWPPDNKKYQMVYVIYSMLMNIFNMGIYYFCETMHMITILGNWEKVTIDMNLFLVHNVFIVKLCLSITKSDKLKKLVKLMDDEIFKPQNALEWAMGTRDMLMCKRIIVTQIMAGVVSITLTLLVPLIYKNGQLPASTWYPYDVHKSPLFEITYVYQAICLLIHTFTFFCVDGIYLMLMAHMCGQLNIINFILKNLQKYSRNNVQTGAFEDVSREVNRLLIQCVRRHQYIIR